MFGDSYTTTALLLGLISAASLPLGAALGVFWRPSNHILAFLLAFGGGALLAALTIDLIAPGVEQGQFPYIGAGAALGGVLFKVLDYFINQKGGYLRKPSTAINFWSRQTRNTTRRLLKSMRRLHSMKQLNTHTLDQLANIISVREYPAGAYLYRHGDHPSFMYVIESGAVELYDPLLNGKPFATLGTHDVFGRMSFYTGLHRRTEAKIVKPAKLMCIPRQPFFNLLSQSKDLCLHVQEQLNDGEVSRYLTERWHTPTEQIDSWLAVATNQLNHQQSYAPPLFYDEAIESLPDLLRNEKRLDLFSTFSPAPLESICSRMALNTYPTGFVFFSAGELADRCYILSEGTVYLLDTNNHSREPIVIQAGEMFGAYSFLTASAHSMTAICHEDCKIWELRSEDFQELCLSSENIREQLNCFLEKNQISEYLTHNQGIDSKRAALWLHKATKAIASGVHFPSVGEMNHSIANQSGAPLAMYLGILLDGIPESFVIGAEVMVGHGLNLTLIGGLFLANFPEALSSSAGMKEQGFKSAKILMMWFSLMLMTGVGAAFGVTLLEGAPPGALSFIKGLAAGAMLTMIAETMLPEAFHNGSSTVGLSTLAGFLTAIMVNQI